MKKLSLLFLVFLLPLLITLYLKFFTEHHYKVEVLYQDSIPATLLNNCASIRAPYSIQNDLLPSSERGRKELQVYLMYSNDMQQESLASCIGRTSEVFEGKELNFVVTCDSSDLAAIDALNKAIQEFYSTSEAFVEVKALSFEKREELSQCILLMDSSVNSVLIDHEGRIRSYYKLPEEDETSRLSAELKIIFKEEYGS